MTSTLHTNFQFTIYQSLFLNNQDGCYALDREGKFILVNKAAEEITGYRMEEILHTPFLSLVQPDCREQDMERFVRILSGEKEECTTSLIHKSGKRVDVFVTAIPIYENGELLGVVGMARDITEQNIVEHLLNGQNKVLEMIAKGSPFHEVLKDIICMVEKTLTGGICSIHVVDFEESKLELYAAPHLPENYIPYVQSITIGPDEAAGQSGIFLEQPVIATNIAEEPLWAAYMEAALSNGLQSCWSAPVLNNHGQVIGKFAVYYKKTSVPHERDLQIIDKAMYLTSLAIQHYRAEEKISFMAFHDELTQLPNRRLFQQRVTDALNSDRSEDNVISLLYLDLDRFKNINDSLGHTIGDLLLQNVAKRLQGCIRETDMASRQGGDEFTILLNDIPRSEINKIAARVLDVLSQPFSIQGHEIFITPSIGISICPQDGDTENELLRKADIAMYQAKKEGKNNYRFYTELLDQKIGRRLDIENKLCKALKREEFTLHYQPIIDLSTNELAGVEALIRWEHPVLGRISPDDFIPIAEETGLIVPIGEWVLKTAFRQWQTWRKQGIVIPTMAVNISFRQFYQPDLTTMIGRILIETEMNPANVTIEITESMTMNVETATKILYDLKSLGVSISIDDFGTGYSSLSYLRTFPIDSLKIDKSFIRDISTNKDGENIATTILLMAHNLGLRVIAEGVETGEQLNFLSRHGCSEAQGYFFSKPISAAEIPTLGL